MRPQTTIARLRRFNATRLALTLFALFAFTVQSYVAQVHVHGATWSAAAHKPQQDKQPAGDDQTNCPICQVIAHSGHFVTPTVAAWAPLIAAVYVVAIVQDTATVGQAASHSWQSRGPPSA